MTLLEAIQENSELDKLKNILTGLFKEYDSVSELYSYSVKDINSEQSDIDTTDLLDNANKSYEFKKTFKKLISVLNKIQTVFEKIGYDNVTQTTDDVTETSFIKQLQNFSAQGLKLIENFDRKYFQSFVNQLNYLTALAEIHYNNKLGDLDENIQISKDTEEVLEETEEYLDEQPDIPTNELT